jgi:predicted ABC-type ATPase
MPAEAKPQALILAGPNGAGKTTFSRTLLEGSACFLNADLLAEPLDEEDEVRRNILAGRLALRRLKELIADRETFVLETTLATRALAKYLTRMKEQDFEVRLLFIYLPSPEMAIERVAKRVRAGGHSIPEATVRRRYKRGLANLFRIYLGLVDSWTIWNNEDGKGPEIIASGRHSASNILDGETYEEIWSKAK